MRLILTGLLFLAAVTPGFASIVNVTYAGHLTSSDIASLPVGSTFTGTFTYRTDLLPDIDGIGFRTFFLDTGALTVTFGVDTVANTNGNLAFNDLVLVQNTGLLEIGGNAMGGNGPLNGGSAFVIFEGSSDPDFAALILPFPFPLDFSVARFVANSAQDEQISGILTDFKAENIDVPEPGTSVLALAGLVLVCLRVMRPHSR